MVHAGASTSCHLLSVLLVHPKYLLMTAYNEMVKFPPSVVLPRYIDAKAPCRDSFVTTHNMLLELRFYGFSENYCIVTAVLLQKQQSSFSQLCILFLLFYKWNKISHVCSIWIIIASKFDYIVVKHIYEMW